jgi:hypothetical protein
MPKRPQKVLDAIAAGFLEESDLKGLKKAQVDELAKEARLIYLSEMRAAKHNEQEAERATERAGKVEAPKDRQRFEKQAAVFAMQAEQHKKDAKTKARIFGKQAAEMYREDLGRPAVQKRAAELRTVVHREEKVYQVDDLAAKIAKRLEKFADEKHPIREELRFLKANAGDLSEYAANGLDQSFGVLIARLERARAAVRRAARKGPRPRDVGTVTDPVVIDPASVAVVHEHRA